MTPQGARWTYAYDPFGRRVEKRERLAPGPLGAKIAPRVCGTRFVWDGDVLAEEIPIREDETLDPARRVEWLFEEGGFAALARADAAGVAYVVADHLGTPRELISAQGEMVWAASWRLWGAARRMWRKRARAAGERERRDDAWRDDEEGGARIGAQAFYADAEPAFEPMPFRFPGQFEDAETGLYYNRHRHYDPLAGGYVSPDPIGLSGGDRPGGYVERPGCWVDPLGLFKTFTSTEKYVGELATEIEKAIPGSVKGVNVPIKRPDGTLITDADILLSDGTVIQVKEGTGKGLTNQVKRTIYQTGARTIGYAPDSGPHLGRGFQAEKLEFAKTPEQILSLLKK